MSRELTVDECRAEFLARVREQISYWMTVEADKRVLLEGLAFSILVTLDGCVGDMPAFKLVTEVHPDDKQYAIDEGENWWPADVDICGGMYLHEDFYIK